MTPPTHQARAKRAQLAPKTAAEQKPFKQVEIGRILSVGSSRAMVTVNKNIISKNMLHLAQLGTILKILTSNSIVVAMVSSLDIAGQDDEGMNDGCIARLDILGEITTNPSTKQTRFFRGVRSFPVLNEAVYNMSPDDLKLIFSNENEQTIRVGRLQQDNNIVAQVRTDDLLSKHFAIIGSTGSGKSCTVALVLGAILQQNRDAHVVLFDPHNEYSKSFGDMAEVVRQDTLDLPLWLFDFDETVQLLTSEILQHRQEETELLSELILKAKQLFEQARQQNGEVSAHVKIEDLEKDLHRTAAHISLDSPVPYRIRDVLKLINYKMGKLENSEFIRAYKRLKRKIEGLMMDPRYQFIFRNQAQPKDIQGIIGQLFRIPVNNKPICILDFSSIPSESIDIVVSVVSRLAFELAMWSNRAIPILLVCEEAHRYIPVDDKKGFTSTRKAISRIAKEGRKYGVSLAIISQRPSELDPSTLSQCGTIFSMRLSNERDQAFVRAAVPDGAGELLTFLPSLGTAETMVFGEAVNLPMRIVLNTLHESRRPHSSSAAFTDLWSAGEVSSDYMDNVFKNWRNRSFEREVSIGDVEASSSAAPAIVPTMGKSAGQSVARRSVRTTTANPSVLSRLPSGEDISKVNSLSDMKAMLSAVTSLKK